MGFLSSPKSKKATIDSPTSKAAPASPTVIAAEEDTLVSPASPINAVATTPVSGGKERTHVRFEEPATPSSANALMDAAASPSKKGRPSLRSQTSLGGRIMASLSRTLSAMTPRSKDEAGWRDVDVPERFLLACGGKKKKAVGMYRAMLRWRKENGIGEEEGGGREIEREGGSERASERRRQIERGGGAERGRMY
ncbi:Hypothetical protein NocV09_10600110 [Nannochloropsis oceanica]